MRTSAYLALAFIALGQGCGPTPAAEEVTSGEASSEEVEQAIRAYQDEQAAEQAMAVDPRCEASPGRLLDECAVRGRCVVRGDRCVATSRARCEASLGCRRSGRCALGDGECVAAEEAHCAGSRDCASHGTCSFVDGSCRPSRPEHCRGSEECTSRGNCSLVGGACRASSDAECRSSTLCRQMGLCAARDGGCVASSDADCRASEYCDALGSCAMVRSSCGATSDADCLRSDACRERGRCALSARNDSCEPRTEAHCRQASRCPPYCELGPNRAGYMRCRSPSAEACTAADACPSPPCALVDGVCASASDPAVEDARQLLRAMDGSR